MHDALHFTRHANRRCRERGLRQSDVVRLVNVADRQVFMGDCCTSLCVTREGAAYLLGEGWPPAELMRLMRHCVLLGETGEVITVLVGNRRRMRRYRRVGGRR